jgi:hypothetical protein
MCEYPIEVTFNGNTYRRYPNSPDKAKQRYYVITSGRGYRTLHRDVWSFHNGDIPKGYHVHHKDGNYFNNSPENLECLSPKEHAEQHTEEFYEARVKQMAYAREFASKWHGSPEGLEFHRQLGRLSWEGREPEIDNVCEVCGSSFKSFVKAITCSTKCKNRRHELKYKQEAECPMCGETFLQNKYKLTPTTCSRKCGASLRKQLKG